LASLIFAARPRSINDQRVNIIDHRSQRGNDPSSQLELSATPPVQQQVLLDVAAAYCFPAAEDISSSSSLPTCRTFPWWPGIWPAASFDSPRLVVTVDNSISFRGEPKSFLFSSSEPWTFFSFCLLLWTRFRRDCDTFFGWSIV
jgi:hypothetical protein